MNDQDKFYSELDAELAKHPKPAKEARRRKVGESEPQPSDDENMTRFRQALGLIMSVPKTEVDRLVANAKRKKDKLGERRYRKT